MARKTLAIGAIGALALGTGAALAQPTLSGPVSDHAVIQRDAPIVLSGSAMGDSVSVRLGEASAEADVADGRWRAELPAMPAGGPYALSVADADGETRVEDVLIGDVWLCSGQSNMVFGVSRSLPAGDAISGPPGDRMRLMTVPNVSAVSQQSDMPDGAAWTVADPQAVQRFSAVCYFAARAFRGDDTETPIGLINASWGGAQIEAFVPAENLREAGGFESELDLLETYAEDSAAALRGFGAPWQDWWRGVYGTQPWLEDGTGPAWKDAPDEMVDWKTYDDPEAQGHLGQVWYAKTFTLTEAQAAQGGRLSLGMFDDVDASWLNGIFLGSTHSWSDPRTYAVKAGELKPGRNTVVINVLNTYGPGGMTGPADVVALHLNDGGSVPLAGGWRYDVVTDTDPNYPNTPWGDVNGYTTIHNAMIAPLGETAMSAALWYQGESNAERPETYEALLDRLIAGWRRRFGAELPVAVIQLPNYGAMPDEPVNAGWAGLQEAQRRAAVADPLTGLVVTVDIGEPGDIHPPNKAPVGVRAARVLHSLMEGGDALTDGVSPLGARRTEGGVAVRMPTDALKTISAARPIAFELCGANGACEWTDATLDGDTVTLAAARPAEAAEVRYCWGEAPICNLFTLDGTPVTPFRLAVE